MAVVGDKRQIMCIYELMLALKYIKIHYLVFDIHLALILFVFFVGHALDDLNLDDIDINSIDRELDKDEVNSLSSSLSAGIPTSGIYVVTLKFYSKASFYLFCIEHNYPYEVKFKLVIVSLFYSYILISHLRIISCSNYCKFYR